MTAENMLPFMADVEKAIDQSLKAPSPEAKLAHLTSLFDRLPRFERAVMAELLMMRLAGLRLLPKGET